MFHFATSTLTHLLTTYGYWAVLLFVAIESTGVPFPGETMLLVAAIYAGMTHLLFIPPVIVAAASDAILGDLSAFGSGAKGGYRLLRRFGRYLHKGCPNSSALHAASISLLTAHYFLTAAKHAGLHAHHIQVILP